MTKVVSAQSLRWLGSVVPFVVLAVATYVASGVNAQEPPPQPPSDPIGFLHVSEIDPAEAAALGVEANASATNSNAVLSGCWQPCWGPGYPTVFSQYFLSAADWFAKANAKYIGQDGLVPRKAFLSAIDANYFGQPPDPPMAGYPNIWYFVFYNPANEVMYWVSITNRPNQISSITDSQGTSTFSWNPRVQTGIRVDCTLPDGQYKVVLQYVGVYTQTRRFYIGGSQSCSPPSPSPTPVPTPTPTPTPVPSPSPSPGPPTSAPVLSVPRGCISTRAPRFSWSAVNQADLYLIEVENAETGNTVFSDDYVVTTYFDTPVPRDGGESPLAANTPYRWRVRARNNYGDGPESETVAFTPNCGKPQQAPTAVSPSGCTPSLTPVLTWSSVLRATEYQVRVSDAITETEVDETTTSATSHAVPTGRLTEGRDFRWKVRARNAAGDGPYSTLLVFTPGCTSPSPAPSPMPTPTPVPEEPTIRPTASDPCSPEMVHEPVSVLTGNMALDQTDITVGGVVGLTLARSYNSANVISGRYGIFGPGWNHSFESSLAFPASRTIMFRQANGATVHFEDGDGDGIYKAFAPRSETSTIVRNTDGTYRRMFRVGGGERYDSAGRLVSLEDAVGNTVVLTRDAVGQIETLTDPGGRALSFVHEDGRLVRVSGPGGTLRVLYGYVAGRLDSVTYAEGSGYQFTYDGAGRLLTVIDHSGRTLETHTYDAATGRALTSEVSAGREKYSFAYEPLQTTVTDAFGSVTTYEYAEIAQIKRLKRIVGPCQSCGGMGSEIQEWKYDASGRVVSHSTGPETETGYEYDPTTGDLIIVKDALLDSTLNSYDEKGRVLTVTAPDRGTKAFTYGPAGPLTITESIADGRVRTTRLTYTPRGELETVTDARGKVTTYLYKPSGDLDSVIDPLNHVTTFEYDSTGRRRAMITPMQRRFETSYDDAGRVRGVKQANGATREFTYDLGGRRTAVTDPLNRVSRIGYDEFGRPQTSVDTLNAATSMNHDLMSRVTSVRDAEGRTTEFDRDGHGRPTRIVRPGGGVELLAYDSLGRVAERTDPRGTTTKYAYDALGHLLGKRYSDGSPPVTFEYDSVGRMTRAANATDTLTWTHDHLGRILTESSSRYGSVLSYTYDDVGNLTEVELDGSVRARYVYDDASRLWRILAGRDARVFEFGYDNDSRRTTLTYPNGVVTSYDHGSSHLRAIEATKGGVVLDRSTYTHDSAGNRTSRSTLDRNDAFSYDEMDRLIEVQREEPSRGWKYHYDRTGNRIGEEIDGSVLKFAYNRSGQLTASEAGGPVSVAVPELDLQLPADGGRGASFRHKASRGGHSRRR